MTTPTATELTTRDVLLQVDRRLTLIEGDLRGLDQKIDDRTDGLRHEMSSMASNLRGEMNAMRTEIAGRIDSRFTWSIVTLVGIAGVLLAAIKL